MAKRGTRPPGAALSLRAQAPAPRAPRIALRFSDRSLLIALIGALSLPALQSASDLDVILGDSDEWLRIRALGDNGRGVSMAPMRVDSAFHEQAQPVFRVMDRRLDRHVATARQLPCVEKRLGHRGRHSAGFPAVVSE